jgi:hypothetical protein
MGVELFGPLNSGAAVGADGAAISTGTSSHRIKGEVLEVYVKYNDSPPAGTTDVIVSTQGTAPALPALALLTLTNAATNGYFRPRGPVHSLTGAALTYDSTEPVTTPVAIDDFITVTIDDANAGDNVDVWLMLRC